MGLTGLTGITGISFCQEDDNPVVFSYLLLEDGVSFFALESGTDDLFVLQ